MQPAIPLERWSKEHWSLLAYVETVCVEATDAVGTLDRRKVRCNSARHPLCGSDVTWHPNHGTRLDGFFDFDRRADTQASEAAGLLLTEHDDWDCLDDLNAAGLVDTLSVANGLVRLTEPGIAVCAQLRAHKARGGMFARFKPTPSAPASRFFLEIAVFHRFLNIEVQPLRNFYEKSDQSDPLATR